MDCPLHLITICYRLENYPRVILKFNHFMLSVLFQQQLLMKQRSTKLVKQTRCGLVGSEHQREGQANNFLNFAHVQKIVGLNSTY